MSTLMIEVCEVAAVEPHPHADRLGIATVKGWKTVIGFDPATGTYEFAPGDRCIYFPPDSVLPPELANSPHRVCKTKGCKAFNKTPPQLAADQRAVDGRCALCGNGVAPKDGTLGRTGAMAFCGELPADANGVRPPGGRVRAARLRGLQSFGFIMKIDPAQGDDPAWPVGTDLRDHFGVTKWEPPLENVDGEVETPHPAFHAYTDIEHLANFPGLLLDGEDVVMTEKLHGKNCRVGLVLAEGQWTFMAGSHGHRRKEVFHHERRFLARELVYRQVLPDEDVTVGQEFQYDNGTFWRVTDVRPAKDGLALHCEERVRLGDGSFQTRLRRSEFWEPMTDAVRALLKKVRDDRGDVAGIVLFGELYGTQDMKYGLKNQRGFRAFDLAVDGRYLDHDRVMALCERFGVETVPVLYRGPFSSAEAERQTDGPTVMCSATEAGPFGGREGSVVKPAVERFDERMVPTGTHGRVIFKSVSADYLARRGGTDAH
jgi:RNA ligase (TIGR02306 family)